MDVYHTLQRSVQKGVEEMGRQQTSLSQVWALPNYEHVTMLLGHVLCAAVDKLPWSPPRTTKAQSTTRRYTLNTQGHTFDSAGREGRSTKLQHRESRCPAMTILVESLPQVLLRLREFLDELLERFLEPGLRQPAAHLPEVLEESL